MRCWYGCVGSQWAGAAGCVAKVTNSIWVNAAVSYAPGVKTEFSDTASFAGRLGAFSSSSLICGATPLVSAKPTYVGFFFSFLYFLLYVEISSCHDSKNYSAKPFFALIISLSSCISSGSFIYYFNVSLEYSFIFL